MLVTSENTWNDIWAPLTSETPLFFRCFSCQCDTVGLSIVIHSYHADHFALLLGASGEFVRQLT